MDSWMPNRQYAHMVIDMDQNTFGFENDQNKWIKLDPYNDNQVQSIRNAWHLLTTDMRRSKMSVVILIGDITYELFYKMGYRLSKMPDGSDEIFIGGRPMTPHHVEYCALNECGYDEARKNIAMTPESIEKWTRGNWYARKTP